MPRNLILAYVATWLIHGSYLVYLLKRSKKTSSRLGEGPTTKS
jgi:CcmD family protein